MKLIWHIVRKDVRRLMLPTALWLVFIVGSAVAFRLAPVGTAGDWASWFDIARAWVRLLMAMQVVFGFVLGGTLVLEDPLVGDRAFWPTKPISGWRLCAAKVCAALLLFVVAPVVTLLPVWFAFGFDAGAARAAMAELGTSQLLLTSFALGAGALSRNLAQLLFYGVVLGAVVSLAPMLASLGDPSDLALAARRSRVVFVQMWVQGAVVAAGVHQFVTRRQMRSWLVLIFGVLIALGIGRAWRGENASPSGAPERIAAGSAGRSQAAVTALRGRINSPLPTEAEWRYRVPTLEVELSQKTMEGLALPTGGVGELQWPNAQPVRVRLERSRSIPEAVVRAGVGVGEMSSKLSWPLRVRRLSAEEAALRPGPVQWKGMLNVGVFRHAFSLELPLRADAVARAGANRLRVLSLQASDAGGTVALIEERDAWAGLGGGGSGSRIVLGLRDPLIDCFALKTAKSGEIHVLHPEEVGAVNLASMMTGVLRLKLPRELDATELDGAVLIKLRFRLEQSFAQPATASAVEVIGDQEP